MKNILQIFLRDIRKIKGNTIAMIMMIDISHINCDFKEFVDHMSAYGDQNNLKIHVMHEDIFNSMHRI